MSAMQERGREEIRALLMSGRNGDEKYEPWVERVTDLILSFTSSREDKARREAVEETIEFYQVWIRENVDRKDPEFIRVIKYFNDAESAADRALLPSPATGKCDCGGAGICDWCIAKRQPAEKCEHPSDTLQRNNRGGQWCGTCLKDLP